MILAISTPFQRKSLFEFKALQGNWNCWIVSIINYKIYQNCSLLCLPEQHKYPAYKTHLYWSYNQQHATKWTSIQPHEKSFQTGILKLLRVNSGILFSSYVIYFLWYKIICYNLGSGNKNALQAKINKEHIHHIPEAQCGTL